MCCGTSLGGERTCGPSRPADTLVVDRPLVDPSTDPRDLVLVQRPQTQGHALTHAPRQAKHQQAVRTVSRKHETRPVVDKRPIRRGLEIQVCGGCAAPMALRGCARLLKKGVHVLREADGRIGEDHIGGLKPDQLILARGADDARDADGKHEHERKVSAEVLT